MGSRITERRQNIGKILDIATRGFNCSEEEGKRVKVKLIKDNMYSDSKVIFKSLNYNIMECESPGEMIQIQNLFDTKYSHLLNILEREIPTESLKIRALWQENSEVGCGDLSESECIEIILKYNKLLYKKRNFAAVVEGLKSTKDETLIFNENFKFKFNDIIKIYQIDNPNCLLDPDTFFGDTYIHLIEVVSRFIHIDINELYYIANMAWTKNYYFWKFQKKYQLDSETNTTLDRHIFESIVKSYKKSIKQIINN